MIQELLASGTALILGLIATVLSMGGERSEVAIAPPPMPALENWNPGVRPPTIPEVVDDLLGDRNPTPVPAPTLPQPAPVPPSKPTPSPVPAKPPVEIPKTPVDEPVSSPPVTDNAATTALLKGALVNIICLPAKGSGLRGSSGSGIVVDSRGIIFTVAHVGQHWLFEDYPSENAGNCLIRTGSPARNSYDAELIYISSSWIDENPRTIVTANPKGTGEFDFAFLAITRSLTGQLPRSFVATPLAPAGKDIEVKDKVSTGSYGAEFLSSSEIRSSLYPTITFGSIKEVDSFSGRSIDIFGVNAGAAAQQGSSGGAVLDANNRLLGLITTRTVRADLSLRDLQAITADHVRRSFRAETGRDLDSYLRGSLPSLIEAFEEDAVDLREELSENLN